MINNNTLFVPKHVGIILDGNRRWAKENSLSSLQGHKKGYENLKDIALHAFERGIKTMSVYIFSTENWDRTKEEVGYLMDFALKSITKDIKELHKKDVQVVWLGSTDKLSKKLVRALNNAQETTQNNKSGTLALCFNYGGQQEIADAVKKIVEKGYTKDEITPELISQNIYTSQLVPIDFLIRTSGEKRISNFMLWRIAYSELYFTDKYWPAFTKRDFDDCLLEYANRQRRFGK